MGYYTRFRLSVLPAKSIDIQDQVNKFYEDVEADRVVGMEEYILPNILDSNDTMKWYEHQEDMIRVSELYPQLIFLLEGEGREDEVDVWRCYYKNGKYIHQDAMLTFEEPDLSQLD